MPLTMNSMQKGRRQSLDRDGSMTEWLADIDAVLAADVACEELVSDPG